MEIHETHEHIEEAHHKDNKRAAILIIVLAAALAIVEMAGKEAEFASLASNIETSDLYAFYQAKAIRATVLKTAVESFQIQAAEATAPAEKSVRQKQIESWQATGKRLESEPATHEGQKELLERAKHAGERRDHELHAYHDYEYGAAMLQLAIVMASAAVITEMWLLELVSAGFGAIGIAMGLIGWLAPALLHL